MVNKTLLICLLLSFTWILPVSIIEATAGDFISIPTIEPVIQGHSVNLPQGGSNGTAPWSSCIISTLIDPNHNNLVLDSAMTALGTSSFNYVLPGSNTSILGIYTVSGSCSDGLNTQAFAYTFEVTTTGKDNTSSLWVMLVLLCFSIVILVMAFSFDSIYMAFLSGTLWIISGVLIYFYGFGNISDVYTRAMSFVTLAIGLIIFFAAAFHHGDGENLADAFGLDNKEEVDEHDYFGGTQ